jgi:DNA-binding transcriptional MerR regulator
MTEPLADKRYSIGEVSKITGIPQYTLRQWEKLVPQLKPRRDRANRRYYGLREIDIVRQVAYDLRHRKMTLKGAALAVSNDIFGKGAPENRQQVIELIDEIDEEVREMLRLLGSVE